jgi:signal transduction histidine kinase
MSADPPPSRTRSARLTLISLLVIPLLSLTALWGLVTSITLGNFLRYQHYDSVITAISPSITGLEQTLPVERGLSLIWLGSGRRSMVAQAELAGARHNTDKYLPEVRTAVTSVRGQLNAKATTLMNAFLAEVASVGQIRTAVDSGAYDAVMAYNAYTAIDTAEIAFFQNASPPSDPTLGLMTQAALAEDRAQEATGGAISMILGTALVGDGLMPQPERVLFAQMVEEQNLEIGDTVSLAPPALSVLFQRVYDLPAYHSLQATEKQVEASPANKPIPVNGAVFEATAQKIQTAVLAAGAGVGAVLAHQSAQLRDSVLTDLLLASGLGLVAVVASVFVMVRFSRRLRSELSSLYSSARQMADERLPRLVDLLRRGNDVDIERESPPLKQGRITEIANVAQAFSTVQRTAVEAAVGQASLRKGINQVFVNLSLRNQSLLHRQHSVLDTMERATADPAVLADLFRLDHLTTRMRRHAEGLLILAGTTPGRGWRDPVPVADVLQAAVAEVEDYVRVDVVTESTDAVTGPAVNDVIHLVAELAENATAFSPPKTRVVIRGDIVGSGFAVEVEDRGLGMTPEAIAAANERLASPPEFDLANSERLGLFVVSRLAARHGIKVTLQTSPYGGITAIVLLPSNIMVSEYEESSRSRRSRLDRLPAAAPNDPAREAGEHGPTFGMTGRHRLALSTSSTSSPEAGPVEGAKAPLSSAEPQFRVPPWSAQDQPAQAVGSAEPTPNVNGTHLGLPRRVRMASMAPQLYSEPGGAAPAQASGPLSRSPEQTSSRISALQAGWLRGRLDDLDVPDTGPEPPGDRRTGAMGGEAELHDQEVEP